MDDAQPTVFSPAEMKVIRTLAEVAAKSCGGNCDVAGAILCTGAARHLNYDDVAVQALASKISDTGDYLIGIISMMEKIYVSDISWEQKFDEIFPIYGKVFIPALRKTNHHFEYADPDMGYDDDVQALMRALLDFRDRELIGKAV